MRICQLGFKPLNILIFTGYKNVQVPYDAESEPRRIYNRSSGSVVQVMDQSSVADPLPLTNGSGSVDPGIFVCDRVVDPH